MALQNDVQALSMMFDDA